jgi:hypothetical protein
LWSALRAVATGDARPAFLSAMLIGFGVGNHSLVAGLTGLGAVLAGLLLLVQAKARGRLLGFSLAAFAVGMLVHAYLPVRAAALFGAVDRGVDNVVWGDARTLKGFWWLVSAKTFAEKAGVVHSNASPMDLPFLPIEELGMVFSLLSPAGVYFMLRRKETRLAGLAVPLAAAGSMAAALLGGLDPGNPDIRGYLGPAIALIAVLSGVALVVGTTFLREVRLRTLLSGILLGSVLVHVPWPSVYPGLRFAAASDFEVRDMLAGLPSRAALLTYHFETGFQVGYQRFVEGARPDVLWAHMAFAAGPGFAERMRAAHPESGPLIDAYRGHVGFAEQLGLLDEKRPIRIEPDVATPPAVRRIFGPAGELWALSRRTSPEGVEPLQAWMVDEAARDRQVRGFLAFRRYVDAVWSCEQGFVGRADELFAELAKLVPDDQRFRALERRCE